MKDLFKRIYAIFLQKLVNYSDLINPIWVYHDVIIYKNLKTNHMSRFDDIQCYHNKIYYERES